MESGTKGIGQWVLKLIKSYTPDSAGIVFDYEALQDGPAIVGSPAEAVARIEAAKEYIGLDRMIFMFDLGGIPDENLYSTIELFGKEVIPKIQ